MLNLKKEIDLYEPHERFFLVSIMIILVIFTHKFNQYNKYYKYPDQTIGRRHPAALMKKKEIIVNKQSKTKTKTKQNYK